MILTKSKIYEYNIIDRKIYIFKKKEKLFFIYGCKFSYDEIIKKLFYVKKEDFDCYLMVAMAGVRTVGKKRLWNKLSKLPGEDSRFRKIASLIFLHEDFTYIPEFDEKLHCLLTIAGKVKNHKAFHYLATRNTNNYCCLEQFIQFRKERYIKDDVQSCRYALAYACKYNRLDLMNYYRDYYVTLCRDINSYILSKIMKLGWYSFAKSILSIMNVNSSFIYSKDFTDDDKLKIYDYFMKKDKAETSKLLNKMALQGMYTKIAFSVLKKHHSIDWSVLLNIRDISSYLNELYENGNSESLQKYLQTIVF